MYVHKDSTSRKAENYSRFVPLCNDGVWWCVKFEVLVDREMKVVPRSDTDQWIQQENSVFIVALWVCGRLSDEMIPDNPISRKWEPKNEANPKHRKRLYDNSFEANRAKTYNPHDKKIRTP